MLGNLPIQGVSPTNLQVPANSPLLQALENHLLRKAEEICSTFSLDTTFSSSSIERDQTLWDPSIFILVVQIFFYDASGE